MRTRSGLVLCALAALTLPTVAFAYIDPNASGMLFQLLTPILAMIAATVAFARRQISQGFHYVLRKLKGFVGLNHPAEITEVTEAAEPGDK